MVYRGGQRVAKLQQQQQQQQQQYIVVPPSKPLTRVVARSKQGRGDVSHNNVDAYRMEVNEYVPRREVADKVDVFPCVTVLDMKTFVVPNSRKQRRVWIPVTLCWELVDHLKKCGVRDGDEGKVDRMEGEGVEGGQKERERGEGDGVGDGDGEGSDGSPIGNISHDDNTSSSAASVNQSTRQRRQRRQRPRVPVNVTYDTSKLELREFICMKTNRKVAVERYEGLVCLRSYMDSYYTKRDSSDVSMMEIIELRNSLLGRLIKFLSDVATRYQPLTKDCSIPSLYSYSGERRFYYDLRETRWGIRLQISQVTDLHRNVIGIPLETVVDFRDRLNQFISMLHLDTKVAQTTTTSTTIPRRRSYSNRNSNRKGKRLQTRRGTSNPEKEKNPMDVQTNLDAVKEQVKTEHTDNVKEVVKEEVVIENEE